MYAAAGGASCRNARKRQQQQANKDKLALQQALKEKLAKSKANLTAEPTKSKQFHQLPPNYYLKAPYTGMRKHSAQYTGHSKLLLPINEQSAQQHSPSHQVLSTLGNQQPHPHLRTPMYGLHAQHHHHQMPHYREDLRLDVEHKPLTKSATASFPLVSQAAASPPATPTRTTLLCPFHHPQQFKESQSNLLSVHVPNDNGIIITPATPLVSPSPSGKDQQHQHQQQQMFQLSKHQQQQQGNDFMASLHDLHSPKIVDDLPEFPLERTCSVYRNRKLDAEEAEMKVNIGGDDEQQFNQQQFYIGTMPNGLHQPWTDNEFCDAENRACVCTCDRAEVNCLMKKGFQFFLGDKKINS